MGGLLATGGIKTRLDATKLHFKRYRIIRRFVVKQTFQGLTPVGGAAKGEFMASRAPSGPFILYVKFEKREDGGLRAYCDELPGFILSHANADAVMADVVPSLECILSAMYNRPMKVERAHDLGHEQEQNDMRIPPAHMCRPLQYVGHSSAH
jgi:hypothetical protein